MESDNDSLLVMTFSIGHTALNELALHLEEQFYGDVEYPTFNRKSLTNVVAVIDKDNQHRLAKRLGIQPDRLKSYLVDKFSDNGYIAYTSYVHDAFHDALEFILDSGGKYRFKVKR